MNLVVFFRSSNGNKKRSLKCGDGVLRAVRHGKLAGKLKFQLRGVAGRRKAGMEQGNRFGFPLSCHISQKVRAGHIGYKIIHFHINGKFLIETCQFLDDGIQLFHHFCIEIAGFHIFI